MVKVNSKALNKTIEVGRIIGHIEGKQPGPVNIFLGGIHGNEPAGVFALKEVLNSLSEKKVAIKGSIYAISGNLSALEKGFRYQKQDLNRIWTADRIQALRERKLSDDTADEKEQIAIFDSIMEIMATHKGPFYFADLHTTSSHTIPFITLNDTMLNRRFTLNYPIPLILGIEEYLTGPVLSYINELGYVAFGFEGGQHDEKAAVTNHIAFIYVTLGLTGAIVNRTEYAFYLSKLAAATMGITGFYEIFHREHVVEADHFMMRPGYVNFQCIKTGSYLATSKEQKILAQEQARIFMPLYQKQGDDGFFLIRRIAPFFLKLSVFFRKLRLDKLLVLLPGVSWRDKKKDYLKVNLKIARFFTKPFFHLLGYRSVIHNEKYLFAHSRETASRDEEYQNTHWFNRRK
ncbi:MAG: hypothetical protein ACI9XJ_001441 [Marivirga sp.]|jgi:hypothetical protein